MPRGHPQSGHVPSSGLPAMGVLSLLWTDHPYIIIIIIITAFPASKGKTRRITLKVLLYETKHSCFTLRGHGYRFFKILRQLLKSSEFLKAADRAFAWHRMNNVGIIL
jgi:hypothetical protein